MNDIVTFRINPVKKTAVYNLDAYPATQDWQIAHIKKAVREADKGEFASADEVKKAFARWQEHEILSPVHHARQWPEKL